MPVIYLWRSEVFLYCLLPYFLIIYFYFYVYKCFTWTYLSAPYICSACWGRKRVLDQLELELAAMWVLGTELQVSCKSTKGYQPLSHLFGPSSQSPYIWRQGHSLNLDGVHQLAGLADQWASRTKCLPRARIIVICHTRSSLCGRWGPELRSSCLSSKIFNHWDISKVRIISSMNWCLACYIVTLLISYLSFSLKVYIFLRKGMVFSPLVVDQGQWVLVHFSC